MVAETQLYTYVKCAVVHRAYLEYTAFESIKVLSL